MKTPVKCATELIKICEQIAASRKEIFSMKMREKAIEVIGLVNSTETTDCDAQCEQLYEECVSSLLRIGEGPPQPELQLSVGAALFHSALGLHSPLRRDQFEQLEAEITLSTLPPSSQQFLSLRLPSLLDRLLLCQSSSHLHQRRAAFSWLLVVLQKVSLFSPQLYRPRLQHIQEAFCDGLTESNEFVQEISSRGLGTVYEMAGEELKKELVGTLLSAITEGRRITTKIEKDSVVFEENELGKAPDGSSLSTYKALCDLATDMNQPDLIYKFMQLAKHNATWNSKKGAAFGFGALLEHAREELEPYFGQLVPKIFRYRYDPDVKLQNAFKGIYNALTQNKKNVMDEFADEIAKELLSMITNKEWRVRESCCLALSDLLRGHDTLYIHSRLPEIFDIVLRLKDDVKESVRLAAERAAESVRRLIIRLSTSSNEAKSQAFLSQMLPVILNCATQSPIKVNKAFGLILIIELFKSSASQLKPHAAVLIPQLLESISDNESAVLNYLAARSNEAQLEALDDARASLARTSPMMSAVNDLLPQIDSSVLVAMQPRLSELLHSSVGVSTRSASAQFVTMLCLRAPQLLLDHRAQCDRMFHSIVPSLRDRNPSVRKQMAGTASHLAKFVSANEISNLMKTLAKDLVSDREDMKQGARHVLRSLSHNCPELLSNFSTQIVPYVFLGKCMQVEKGDEVAKKKQAEWEELWTEIVPSTNAAVRLYGNEIFDLGLSTLKESEIWSVRVQAAKMLEEAVRQLKGTLEANKAAEVIGLLLPLLSGRIWAGKESILITVRAILEANPSEFRKHWNEEIRNQVKTILQREASKKNKPYVTQAIQTAAVGAAALRDKEWAETVHNTAVNNVDRIVKGEAASSEEEMEALERQTINDKFLEANLLALVLLLQTYQGMYFIYIYYFGNVRRFLLIISCL
ncbi:hypothetical protein WR25_18846 isoform A [Diploscapter pachys]|uniref:Proteasome adapter and scaffold protein ECM29 HEAT-repeat domain-containing protein n=1 Tax=Diploscapter pachys TaxID=2018661 RepID=A0A2A2KAI1_9BILA|nr:hypothetical protein WR25_18846 isoform A [Diploscapter pachys]